MHISGKPLNFAYPPMAPENLIWIIDDDRNDILVEFAIFLNEIVSL